jgi:three-Cys-motif partner protein
VARKTSQQLLAELEAQNDGLVSKPVGVWSLEKLAMLALYFHAFTTACKSVGGGFYYDGFAGPGLCRVRNARPLPYAAWGSPLLALRTEPRFERCLFTEILPRNTSALRKRAASFGERARIIEGDVNESAARIVGDEVPRGAPAFCLLDQQGGELHWRTVEEIAAIHGRRRKPELMILFPLRMALLRMLSVDQDPLPQYVERWDRTFGHHRWADVYAAKRAGTLTPHEAQARYLNMYTQGLRDIGYRYVRPRAVTAPRSVALGQPRQEMYHLVFATDHDRADEIMRDVFERPYALDFVVSQQHHLFDG